jgi:hypothetical protein
VPKPLVVFVDVDDTLVRTSGSKRIPLPHVVRHVQELHDDGAILFCWSAGGGEYAAEVATELGIRRCFQACLPKPDVMIDDQPVPDWRRLLVVTPFEVLGSCANDYRTRLDLR